MKLSVISPVYRAEFIVDELVRRVTQEIVKVTDDFEIILVEDGSPDKSWDRIEEQAINNDKVIGIKLSRNYGQHYAITAGIDHASGDAVIVMDCDLQDDPMYIKELVQKFREGYDIVYTRKNLRRHSRFKNLTASFFNLVFNWLVDQENFSSSTSIGTYSLLSRKVVDAYVQIKDYRRHYLMILRWLGFKSTYIEIDHRERYEGESSYNLSKLLNHAIDGITSQSDKVLRLTVIIGFIMSFLAFISSLIIVIRSLMSPFQAGWASISVLILFVGGLIITSIGISGIYIGKIFEQTKSRPLYLIDKVLKK